MIYNGIYLIHESSLEELKVLIESSLDESIIQSASAFNAERTQNISIDENKTANIDIKGILVKQPNKILDYFGVEYTAYSEIIEQTEAANKAGVDKISYKINSPGGNIDGLYDAMKAISSSKVKTESVIDGMAASAAYMLASQSKKIIAKNEISLIGSVGVVATYRVGSDSKEITNRESPKKRPDLSTKEGESVIKDELDDIFDVLVAKIASGRKTTAEIVKNSFGRGSVMTAGKALEAGMIDKIGYKVKKTEEITNAFDSTENIESTQNEVIMDLETLKEKHPDLYKAVYEIGFTDAKKEDEVVEEPKAEEPSIEEVVQAAVAKALQAARKEDKVDAAQKQDEDINADTQQKNELADLGWKVF